MRKLPIAIAVGALAVSLAAAPAVGAPKGSKNPKQVDSTSFSGPEKGQVSLGIYEVMDADNKRACWARPGKPRPTSFDSTPGSGWTVQYWRLITKDVGEK